MAFSSSLYRFCFLVVVNAINFIDGIDGLAITEVIKIIAVFEFFSAGLTTLAPLGLLIFSSILPLYYFNFKKKGKVFLGDGGSMLLGALTMVYVLYSLGNNYSFKRELIMNKTLFVVIVLFYPLFDLLRVFILRIKKGQSPFIADNRHLHHKLLQISKSSISVNFIILIFELAIILITINI